MFFALTGVDPAAFHTPPGLSSWNPARAPQQDLRVHLWRARCSQRVDQTKGARSFLGRRHHCRTQSYNRCFYQDFTFIGATVQKCDTDLPSAPHRNEQLASCCIPSVLERKHFRSIRQPLATQQHFLCWLRSRPAGYQAICRSS